MATQTTSACSLLAIDMIRHQRDHETRMSEGIGGDRSAHERVFSNACTYLTPLVMSCLDEMNRILFNGEGTARYVEPHSDGNGGILASWEFTWPALEKARIKNSGEAYPPMRLVAIFPVNASRGHLAQLHVQDMSSPEGAIGMFGQNVIGTWPIQVTSYEDAAHMESVIWSIFICQIHETTVRAANGWDLIPKYPDPESWGHGSLEIAQLKS